MVLWYSFPTAEAERLVKGVNILVVTPGRLLDHLQVQLQLEIGLMDGAAVHWQYSEEPFLIPATNVLMCLSNLFSSV